MADTDFSRNCLADSASPYLRQHADNPVHWQSWDDASLAHARATDTPILLSIGYSACHWCHVMAHECFEDPDIAAAMNASFVNIKLDREQRPDIDRTYQLAYQALNGRGGGWPLTCFLDPQDLGPFFIGTYFPPAARHGLPAFVDVLRAARAHFSAHRGELHANAAQLQAWLRDASAAQPGPAADATITAALAMDRLRSRFDAGHGGMRGAPKFPQPARLEWLLDAHTGAATGMAATTLVHMAARGLQDHLGGGFFRYCVDADWTIPHFEKMLYDNAQLLPVYARAATTPTLDPDLRTAARNAAGAIVDWLAREMTAPSGALFSSLDADSEHEEGRFYLWTKDALEGALDAGDRALAAAAFGLDRPPNFEGRAWHLLRATPVSILATDFGLSPADTTARLQAATMRLLARRMQRSRPARDDKLLVAWNALAISGLARSSRMLGDPRSAMMSTRALRAVQEGAWSNGLLHADIGGAGDRIPGFLDDYAFLLDAVLEHLQIEFAAADLAFAGALADGLLERFEDRDQGGFWFSASDHATPLSRARDWVDDALPNGNAVAIRALLRLGHLIGEQRYLAAAERALRAAANALHAHPEACPTLLRSLAEFDRPRLQIVVNCPLSGAARWRAAVDDGLLAAGCVPGGDAADAFLIVGAMAGLPGVLAFRSARDPRGTAWICTGDSCLAPVDSAAGLATAIRDARPG